MTVHAAAQHFSSSLLHPLTLPPCAPPVPVCLFVMSRPLSALFIKQAPTHNLRPPGTAPAAPAQLKSPSRLQSQIHITSKPKQTTHLALPLPLEVHDGEVQHGPQRRVRLQHLCTWKKEALAWGKQA
jgi:hypothetical protein